VRCLLIEPFPESALNEQAGKMLLENYEEYARHARSAPQPFSPSTYYILFTRIRGHGYFLNGQYQEFMILNADNTLSQLTMSGKTNLMMYYILII
jgi:hypothetical protein